MRRVELDGDRRSQRYDGMPGGPMMSTPYSAAAATIGAGSGGGTRRREGEGLSRLGQRAQEALEPGGLGDEQEAGLG